MSLPPAPRRLTPERREKLIAAAKAGCHPDICAAKAKMSPLTLARWLERGRQEVANREDEDAPFDPLNPRLDELSPLGLFVLEFDKATAEHEAGLVAQLLDNPGPGDLRWVIERRYAVRWAAKQSVELSGPDGGPVKFEASREALLRSLFPAGTQHSDETDAPEDAPEDVPDRSDG